MKKTPPDPKFDPDVEAITCACDITSGSLCACSAMTESTVLRKLRFSEKESGTGGSLEVVPMDSSWAGGSVGRRDRVYPPTGCCRGNAYL